MIDRTELQTYALRRLHRDTDAERDAFFTDHVDLTSREAYLRWVAAWKQLYQELSGEIRAHKRGMKDPTSPDRWRHQLLREQKRHLATALLALRHTGKRASWAAKQRATVDAA